MLDRAGVDAELVDDIERRIWEKFIFLSTFAAITALTRLPIGVIRADAECRALYRAALDEATAVGRRERPEIAADFADRHMAFIDGMAPGVHASMLDDLTRGKRLELPYLSGRVVELGRAAGIATPVHAMVFAALHPFVDGPPPTAAAAAASAAATDG
jgi:2-dehydropantoate 2-reductase